MTGLAAGAKPASRIPNTLRIRAKRLLNLYFRTSIDLDRDPSNVQFRMQTQIDDGAVIYVNGERKSASPLSGKIDYDPDHSLSIGPLEGINNKIGALQRRAYGYRNFEHLTERLLTLHHAKYMLQG